MLFIIPKFKMKRRRGEENEFIQQKLVTYLKETNPDDLLINATVKCPQFKDESKKLKLFLLDIVNGDSDSAGEVVGKQNRFIA